MADFIVIIILMLLIGSAAAYMIRAKKNGVKCIGCPAGGSCPGSGKIPKKKLAGRVVSRRTMKISGMNCAHCVMDVTKILNQIDGVSADVSLSKGSARISCDREIGDEVLRECSGKRQDSMWQVLHRVPGPAPFHRDTGSGNLPFIDHD